MVHFMLEIAIKICNKAKQAINCFRNPGVTSKCCCSSGVTFALVCFRSLPAPEGNVWLISCLILHHVHQLSEPGGCFFCFNRNDTMNQPSGGAFSVKQWAESWYQSSVKQT